MSNNSAAAKPERLHARARSLFVLSVFMFYSAIVIGLVGIGVGFWTISSTAGTEEADLFPAVAIVALAAVMGFSHLEVGKAAGRLSEQGDALNGRRDDPSAG
ncbi:hypothetical protein AB0O87_13980 [Microbacterium sp. NPDC076768]|uniref:hypothetical protein n=1 Tax=Microbacterium sp. NPDC076768 TaxID=3154858 RepID=UPI003427B834